MRRIALMAGLALALSAGTLAAQGPGRSEGPGNGVIPGPPPLGPGGPHGAGFLLAMTGELRLTDAQVVRLAAIARRAAERHQAQRPPALPPGQRPSDADMARMRQQFEQMREQERTDLRDAIAVLTPDQQARAWEMMAAHHGPGGMDGPGRMRRGMRAPGGMRGAPGGLPPGDGSAPPPRPQG
ncbi:MAG TPA: hypothetical protein VF541_19255 [Longimicrobium sp.]